MFESRFAILIARRGRVLQGLRASRTCPTLGHEEIIDFEGENLGLCWIAARKKTQVRIHLFKRKVVPGNDIRQDQRVLIYIPRNGLPQTQ